MGARLDSFNGTLEQYISYLEDLVLSYRQKPTATRDRAETGLDVLRTSASEVTEIPTHGKRPKCSGQFEFIVVDPRSLQPNPIRQKSAIPRWKQNAIALIRETPKAEDWYKALAEEGIHDAMCSGEAAAYLMATEERLPTVQIEATLPRVSSLTYERLKRGVRKTSSGVVAMQTNFLTSCIWQVGVFGAVNFFSSGIDP
ncbi:hypothetical protein HII31_12471 [Pseudocercospora fuligena]|uniref:Uncharacterized protein n=1 Tax=Pseudocercospora fuligena TaxID=685502 RepID=A0A8H6R8A9_9PEZI|nr:hypothetical protein HII31_12471 [Pseudocercospora fuligena]